jgi:hypothetical protein
LLVEVGGDMSVFHQRVVQLAALDQQGRREGLPRD